ncbi:MAG: caspase family protein [Saprospiraceae bacterium]|nr:caspase family protein [Saprospiraceae bacterium]
MKTIFIFLSIFVLSLPGYSQTLHALLFVNEKEQGRETDRKADMDNMKVFFREIAAQLGYSYNLRDNSDTQFTAAEVNQEIAGLNVQKNDVVVFYYSGHGYNEGSDQWPTLNFKDKNYWLSDILKQLNGRTRSAKLVLCVADCCNKGMSNAALPAESFNPISSANMKALFTGFQGRKTVLMSASKQGQFSWSDLQRGALFGICLRNAVYKYTDNSSDAPTWEAIGERVKETTLRSSGNKQEPQLKIIQAASAIDE